VTLGFAINPGTLKAIASASTFTCLSSAAPSAPQQAAHGFFLGRLLDTFLLSPL
jgi:hypothetical protein